MYIIEIRSLNFFKVELKKGMMYIIEIRSLNL